MPKIPVPTSYGVMYFDTETRQFSMDGGNDASPGSRSAYSDETGKPIGSLMDLGQKPVAPAPWARRMMPAGAPSARQRMMEAERAGIPRQDIPSPSLPPPTMSSEPGGRAGMMQQAWDRGAEGRAQAEAVQADLKRRWSEKYGMPVPGAAPPLGPRPDTPPELSVGTPPWSERMPVDVQQQYQGAQQPMEDPAARQLQDEFETLANELDSQAAQEQGLQTAGRQAYAEGQRRADMMEGIGNLSEFVQNQPWASSAGGLLAQTPYQSAGRETAARTRDELSAEERQFFKDRLGVDLPMGYTRTQLRTSFPSLSSYINPYTEKRIDQAERRLNLQENYQEGIQSRSDRAFALRDEIAHRIPDADMRKLVPVAYTLKQIRWIKDNFDQFQGFVGPIQGRLNAAIARFGTGSPQVAQLQARLTDMLGSYLTQQTGAQRGMTEVAWLSQVMPALKDNPALFMAKLDDLEARVKDTVDSQVRLWSAQGRDVSPIYAVTEVPEFNVQSQGNPGQPGGGMRIKLRKGNEPAMEYTPPEGASWEEIQKEINDLLQEGYEEVQ